MLGFAGETLPNLQEFLYLVQFNVFSSNLQIGRYFGRYRNVPSTTALYGLL